MHRGQAEEPYWSGRESLGQRINGAEEIGDSSWSLGRDLDLGIVGLVLRRLGCLGKPDAALPLDSPLESLSYL
jgi:hypothetical protein